MTTQEIVSKLWNLCNVLRDDGITYHQYVTELTYILFLKMAKETGAESQIPEAYRWDNLSSKSGIELKKFYKELLTHLGEDCTGRVREIYQGAATNIDEPKNLEKIITTIDGLDWFSAREEGLGNLYEGLLEKNANEKKSGAGQYFTPRVLIDVMTKLVKPQPGERCNDPACGTFGFMISASQYVRSQTDDFFDLDADTAKFEREEAFTGCELVHDTHRLALMNAMLHDIEGKITLGDTLSNAGMSMKDYDVVLTNPPFGTKKGGERATRDDFTFPTSNKQLNFLQHIYRSLKANGKARAAVVLPDNVLFADGDGERIRLDLMDKCNLHTILRLPTGIFYAQGVKTNVLFFTRGKTEKHNTNSLLLSTANNSEIASLNLSDEMKIGELVINPKSRSVTRMGQAVSLTPKEFDILYFLAENRGEVFTKEQIYKAVWSENYLLDDSNIMAFIRKLRKKIEPNPDEPKFILTIWGIGYKFNDKV